VWFVAAFLFMLFHVLHFLISNIIINHWIVMYLPCVKLCSGTSFYVVLLCYVLWLWTKQSVLNYVLELLFMHWLRVWVWMKKSKNFNSDWSNCRFWVKKPKTHRCGREFRFSTQISFGFGFGWHPKLWAWVWVVSNPHPRAPVVILNHQFNIIFFRISNQIK
jgi:hypothetical protein